MIIEEYALCIMIHAMSYPQPRRWVTRLDTFIQRKPGKIGTKPKVCDIMNFKYTLETFCICTHQP